jgi:UDPglucose--hexose-1-phosphate uridylyltransferase
VDLKLDRLREQARILDPRSDFSESVSEVEIRIDPLTGRRSRINISRTSRPKQALARVEAASASKCLFCHDSVDTATPRFPPSFLPQGRYKSGGATLFPNLFPLAGNHAVCVFTPVHKIELAQFEEGEILDGIRCSLMYFSKSAEEGFPEHFLGWNHLPAAGASILHPHFQLICSREPLTFPNEIFGASRMYLQRERNNYWAQLSDEAASSPRFIGRSCGFTWLAPWAPSGAFEVLGVSNRSSVMCIDAQELEGMAIGIVKVLKGYASLGVSSINMGLFSMSGEGDNFFRANVRIMARPGTGMSDRALLELYGGEVGLSTLPEDYAGVLKKHF